MVPPSVDSSASAVPLVRGSLSSIAIAIAIANESEYGLGGGVFSPDRERATEGLA